MDVLPEDRLAVISIGDPAQLPPSQFYGHAHALRLEFLDNELEDLAIHGIPAEALCSLEQVESAVHFIRELHASPQSYRLVVHCRMGASRSAAIALVAHSMTQCHFPRWAEANYANKHVLLLAQDILGIQIAVPPFPYDYDYLPSALAI
ncbi:methylamine utilization protein MauD [Novimethylophilus kurashikiensis]|uniref:Methylamine utilization protein MauD n=2 Tax=Novimethylophilus kurashikiensis TaxID=1825523 RepID=A0A2R5FBD2_9PROT|nr:methylamine utilization protein MauD [Novimethylophilus kurashikiensis]